MNLQKAIIVCKAVLLSIFVLLNSSCKKSPTGPSVDDTTPGRRDYVWTVDTIPPQHGFFTRIWGTSPDDIWAVGVFMSETKSLWHYDGKNWSQPPQKQIISGQVLFGFSSNNIWLGTTRGELWHYGGTSWDLFQKPSMDAYNEIVINDMCGKSPDDIYVTGNVSDTAGMKITAIMEHFEGKTWSFVKIPELEQIFYQIIHDDIEDTYLIAAESVQGSPHYFLYTFKEGNLRQIYAGDDLLNLGKMNGRVYFSQWTVFSNRHAINKYQNGGVVLVKDFSPASIGSGVLGRSEKDILIFGYEADSTSGIAHYDGTDLKMLFKFQVDYSTRILFDKDVFSMAFDFFNQNQYFIHGKLKE